jgi:hypothetical protein
VHESKRNVIPSEHQLVVQIVVLPLLIDAEDGDEVRVRPAHAIVFLKM